MNQPAKQLVPRSTCQWDCTGQSRLDMTPTELQVCVTEVDGLGTPLPLGVDRGIGVSSSLLARAERMARHYIKTNNLPTPMPQPERQEVQYGLDIPF